MMDILKIFGKKVQFYRKKRGLSQEELAFQAGLHRTYISQIEAGARNVALKNLSRLAKALDVSIKDFF